MHGERRRTTDCRLLTQSHFLCARNNFLSWGQNRVSGHEWPGFQCCGLPIPITSTRSKGGSNLPGGHFTKATDKLSTS